MKTVPEIEGIEEILKLEDEIRKKQLKTKGAFETCAAFYIRLQNALGKKNFTVSKCNSCILTMLKVLGNYIDIHRSRTVSNSIEERKEEAKYLSEMTWKELNQVVKDGLTEEQLEKYSTGKRIKKETLIEIIKEYGLQ